MKKQEKINNEVNSGKYWLIGIVMFFAGVFGLYLVMYFFPEPFVKTITEQREVKNVTITDTGIAEAVDKVYDSVVVVKTYMKKKLYSTGTGFIYKVDGDVAYILTNNHVIENGDAIYVEFNDGTIVETTVKGKDAYSDIAVLSINSKHVTTVATMGSSEKARIGDTVFTVGAPINSDTYSGTVTRGILSGKNRLISVESSSSSKEAMMMSVLQTDAAINSGNSGGPLFDANGEVIGITSLKLSSNGIGSSATIEGMGFAIPIETALNYAEKLEVGKSIERPLLGISMRNLAEAVYYHYPNLNNIGIDAGVYVEDVSANSPAANAGMEIGDIIVAADDKDVTNLAYLRYLLFNHSVGDTMKIKVYRDGEYKELTLHLNQKAS